MMVLAFLRDILCTLYHLFEILKSRICVMGMIHPVDVVSLDFQNRVFLFHVLQRYGGAYALSELEGRGKHKYICFSK